MPKHITYAFHNELVWLSIEQILPVKQIDKNFEKSSKFQSILASIREIGIVEPVVVYPEESDQYILLDGHSRVHALKMLGLTKVLCMLSTDDEGFTYNKQINRLTAVQENKMLMKTIERGVSDELIARTLNIDLRVLRQKMNMLNGITKEVVEMLANKQVSKEIFRILRKMKPERQIEVAQMMIASNKFTLTYANMMLLSSRKEELVESHKSKTTNDDLADLSIMQKELERLKENYKISEEKLADLKMGLVVAKGYVKKLLNNAAVVDLLENDQNEIYLTLKEVCSIQ
ncbi:plasmid partitioning protein RepB C-terminal domain-containing protein [Pasteurella multocida]|uniref:ParB/RepB/Spo0J family partition protein n=1 Tax=Pasteurella multocida TaxID=747 RepID=UPI002C67AF60|nr:plasmid partitioning protein RepB C-terminal domain-containing protein [Pasteurella multocida]MEB3482993.1 plasmid partitioning protein RepB C-terminal domain-containing protein [Pasteurella multocida]